MNRERITSEILTLLDVGNRDSRHDGDELANQLNRLIYLNASVNEPRGISDAGLPNDVLMQFIAFRIPFNLYTQIVDLLDQD